MKRNFKPHGNVEPNQSLCDVCAVLILWILFVNLSILFEWNDAYIICMYEQGLLEKDVGKEITSEYCFGQFWSLEIWGFNHLRILIFGRAEIWEFRDSGIWEFESLEIRKFENWEKGRFGNLRIGDLRI